MVFDLSPVDFVFVGSKGLVRAVSVGENMILVFAWSSHGFEFLLQCLLPLFQRGHLLNERFITFRCDSPHISSHLLLLLPFQSSPTPLLIPSPPSPKA